MEIKEIREYKIERRPRWKGIGELKEKYCSNKNCAYNQIQEVYTKTGFLGLCWGWFSLDKTSPSLLYCDQNPL